MKDVERWQGKVWECWYWRLGRYSHLSGKKSMAYGAKGSQDKSLCCAQDCESEKPPRSRHRCKYTRVYLQARAWVQVYPTQQSRDLDPETKKCSSFIGASGQWDTQKVAQSYRSTRRWPIELHLTL